MRPTCYLCVSLMFKNKENLKLSITYVQCLEFSEFKNFKVIHVKTFTFKICKSQIIDHYLKNIITTIVSVAPYR